MLKAGCRNASTVMAGYRVAAVAAGGVQAAASRPRKLANRDSGNPDCGSDGDGNAIAGEIHSGNPSYRNAVAEAAVAGRADAHTYASVNANAVFHSPANSGGHSDEHAAPHGDGFGYR